MNRRRMPFLLAFTAVLAIVSLCWLVPLSRTSRAAPAPSAEASFKGKLLLVNTDSMSVFLLETAQMQKVGDRSCLVGKGAADGRMGGWCKGRTVRLPMEHIVSIVEFDDIKDAKKALESGGAMPFGVGDGGYQTTPSSEVPLSPPKGSIVVPRYKQ